MKLFRKNSWSLLVVLVIAMLVISACGGASSTQSNAGSNQSGSGSSNSSNSSDNSGSGSNNAASNSADNSGGNSGNSQASSQPQKGGTLTVETSASINSLDPSKEADWDTQEAIANMFDPLIQLGMDGKLKPWLATDWKTSSDGKTVTIHLQKGVKFQDGTDFNAAAVKFNFERVLDPKTKSPLASDWNMITGIDTPDDYTVVFHLKQPTSDFITNMVWGPLMISPTAVKKEGDKFGQNPVGTGPFKFQSYTSGSQLVMVRNPNYWHNTVYLDKLIVKPVTKSATRLVDFQSGAADVIYNVNPKDVSTAKNAGADVVTRTVPGQQMLSYNLAKEPMSELDVRKAVSYAVNRDDIIKKVFYGEAEKAVAGTPKESWAYDSSLKSQAYNYDPKKAAQLLDAAGWKKGSDGVRTKNGKQLSVTILTQSDPTWVLISQYVAQQLDQLGFKTKIQQQDWGTFLDSMRGGKYDIAYWSLGGWSFGPFNFTDNLSSDQYWNVSQITKNPNLKSTSQKIDKLIKDGKATTDRAKQKQLAGQFQKLTLDQALVGWLWHTKSIDAVKPNVHGYYIPNINLFRFGSAWISQN